MGKEQKPDCISAFPKT